MIKSENIDTAVAPRVPKHRTIYEKIREEIVSGRYGNGRRLPSEAELVDRFKVSRPTVGRALRDLQVAGLVVRRAGAGSFTRLPQALGTFGLIIPGLGNTEIFEPICAEMARVAQTCHHTLLWGDSSDDLRTGSRLAEQLCQQYSERKVAGVFFAPLELVPDGKEINQRIVESLTAAGIPLVLLDRDISDFPLRSAYDVVGIDNFASGYRMAEHVLHLGCRRILFVARPHSAQTVDLRIAGCREAMVRNQVRPADDWVRLGDPTDATFVGQLMAARPAVIQCANDVTAALLLRTLNTMDIRVPHDVRVVGFDDLNYARLLAVPLTTMHQPCRAIGAAAVRAMQERIADPTIPPREILLTAELVVRQSCGTPAPRK